MKNIISKGINLEDFLKKYGDQIKTNTRLLYVVEPRLEKGKIIKFGIAGMQTGNAFSRLKEYTTIYGNKDKSNPCKGVIIYFAGVTAYNRLVEQVNSQVYKIERKLKEHFKSSTEQGRGVERISNTQPIEVIQEIYKISKNIKDVETKITRDARETTKQYRTDKRAYNNEPIRRSARLLK